MDLAADRKTTLDITLVQRPGPDAVVSGYVLDADTHKAIPHATISFANQDNGAYGQATTDQDGSYKVRLRSGYHSITVSVYRNDGRPGGYLTWQGILDVPAGDNDFDVTLTPGEESGGGPCCYAYAEGTATAAPAMGGPGYDAGSGGGAAHGGMTQDVGKANGLTSAPSGSAQDFEDLGGGLGPYDAQSRHKLLQTQAPDGSKASPHLELPVLVGLLGLLALVRRRLD
ncbi:MAG: carboxypeptidase-like regulatory domain-containing protein [Thermoplasmatota archaeon]